MNSGKNISKKAVFLMLVVMFLFITGLTAASAERVWQAQTDAVSWVENLVSINWGNTPDTYNYDGSEWLLPSQGDRGEPQCVDLITYYTEHLGHRMSNMNAVQYANTALPEAWTYTNNPQPGDIVVWSGNPGHIGIVTYIDGDQFYFVDTNGSDTVYDYTDEGKQINEGARDRGPKAISSATTYIHPHWEPNDAEKHEMQIIETAQGIYDQYANMYEYINWVSNQQLYYRQTLNNANLYNYELSFMTDYGIAGIKVGVAVLTGSPASALATIGFTAADTIKSELERGQPQGSTEKFIYTQARAGVDGIKTNDLYDIYDSMVDNKFEDATDAANFIIIYKSNEASLASAEMGRQYYYDQINQNPFDYLGDLITSVAPSIIAEKLAALSTGMELAGATVGRIVELFQEKLGLTSDCYDNEHIRTWYSEIKRIEKETTNLLKYKGDGAGSSAIPTYTIHFDAGEGIVYNGERQYQQNVACNYLPTPFRLGYDFVGWYDASGNKYTEKSIASSNMTLTARWIRIILDSGYCGPSLNYVLYGDGLLNISGSGEMTECPWIDYSDRIGEVSLPDGLTNISAQAFYYCKYLHEISIPESVTAIEYEAFAGSGLQSLELPSNLTYLGSRVLYDNTGVTEIIVPGTVDDMDFDGYYYCGPFTGSAIESATLEEGITRIDYCCFASAKKLKHVYLPSTLQIIDGQAFAETILEELIIPDSVYEYGSQILSGNTTITSLTVSKNIESGSFALLGSSIVELTFPEGATVIPTDFCHGVDTLTTVNIPESVTAIGDEAFAETGLQSLDLPSNLTYLGYNILSGNTGVTEITIPGTVEEMACHGYYGYGVFTGSAIENATFEEGITRIDYCCFADAKKLKHVHLPSTLQIIDGQAFAETILEELTIPDSVYEIGSQILSGNTTIKSLMVPKSIESGSFALLGSSITELTFPEGATVIPAEFCYGVNTLNTVNIPESITTIGDMAFAESGLQSLELPSNLTYLGYNILSGNTGVTEITIPGSVTDMNCDGYNGYGVFTGSAIENATLSEGITRIDYCCFAGAKKLKHVHLPSTLQVIDGQAFAETILEELIIPDSVHEFGSEILRGNTTITSLTVSKNIESGSFALLGSNITELTFPEGTTVIPAEFCYGVDTLTTIHIPESVTTIGDEAFAESGLQSLELPSNISYLGYSILSGNTGVIELTVPGTVTNMGYDYNGYGVFSGSAIENATFEEGITSIGYCCFNDAAKVEQVQLPSTLQIIEDSAFYQCNSLTDVYYMADAEKWRTVTIEDNNDILYEVTMHYSTTPVPNIILPSALTTIESESFINIPETSVIFIPATVTSIDNNAFSDGIIIISPFESYASEWAEDHHFEHYEISSDQQ